MPSARYYIEKLKLLSHPEGGFYKETHRCKSKVNTIAGERDASTAIYFLIEVGNFSALHRIKSDEVWHFYDGDELEIIEIDIVGNLTITLLWKNNFQHIVPAGNWFGSRVKQGGSFSLVGCTVAPGFDFNDFEMAERLKLQNKFPHHTEIIRQLTRF
jgi:predicted cupin superfamily sugar epimerase